MDTLTIVNKFCAHNNFMPTELYTTNNNWVVVKYDETERKEYNRLLTTLSNSKVFKPNKVKVIKDPLNNQVGFSPKGYKG
tara:strand:+ start:15 stop:254 length:240 start_codon:yes stop_codon:yes gene_type:complete